MTMIEASLKGSYSLSNTWGLLSTKSYVDMPGGPRKSLYLFLPNFPPINTPFSKEKHQFWPNWVLFTTFDPKYTHLLNLGCFISDENPRSLYQILRKSAPKGRHIYVYHVNVRTLPRAPNILNPTYTARDEINDIRCVTCNVASDLVGSAVAAAG